VTCPCHRYPKSCRIFELESLILWPPCAFEAAASRSIALFSAEHDLSHRPIVWSLLPALLSVLSVVQYTSPALAMANGLRRTCLALPLLLTAINTTLTCASPGDRHPVFVACVSRCELSGCATLAADKTVFSHGECPVAMCGNKPAVALSITRWRCQVSERHRLMHIPRSAPHSEQSWLRTSLTSKRCRMTASITACAPWRLRGKLQD
jgi:hypothetical protein